MTRAKGYNSQLAMAYEQAYGQTPGAPTGYNMPFNQSKLAINQELIHSATIRCSRDRIQPAIGNTDILGSISIPIDQVGIGFWLQAMFGTPVTTGDGAPYIHVFKGTKRQPSLVLEQQYPDIPAYEMYNGCKVSNFAFAYGGDQELTANIYIIGAKRTIGAAPFTFTLRTPPLLKFSNFQGAVEEDGAQLAIVTEASLNVNFGLNSNSYTIDGKGCRTALPEGILQVSGNIKAFFADAELLHKAVNNTKSSLTFKFTSGTHSLQFSMEEVVFQQTSPGIESDKGIYINLPFKAFYENNSGGSAIVATLVNGHAAYAAVQEVFLKI